MADCFTVRSGFWTTSFRQRLASHSRSLALHPRTNRHRRLCLLHVIHRERPQTLEPINSYTESSDEDRPTNSRNVQDACRTLFDKSHIPAWRPELVLYAPIGILLAAFRSALWVLGIYLDQPWFRDQRVVDAYLRLLGVTVVWKHAERIPPGRHLMVSNHCSMGDLMVLFRHPSLPHRYTHLITSALPARVTQCRHLPVVLRHASPAVYDELAASTDPSPVHLFPEGGMTNGRGMLRFSRGFTRIMQQPQSQTQSQQQKQNGTLDQSSASVSAAESISETESGSDSGSAGGAAVAAPLPVVPVALCVKGMHGVCTHTLTSAFLSNLFWFSFSPGTTLEATVLPAMVPKPGEARGAFVKRVQGVIADELGVEVYDMTIQQKRQVVKVVGEARS